MIRMPEVSKPHPLALVEAGLAIASGSLRIRLQSFDRVARWAIGSAPAARPADVMEAAQARRAVLAWSRRVPWRALCMEQGIAAARLLARRGLPAVIHYGAVVKEGSLTAHVWVTSASIPVIGCENASEFAVLSRFSNGSSS